MCSEVHSIHQASFSPAQVISVTSEIIFSKQQGSYNPYGTGLYNTHKHSQNTHPQTHTHTIRAPFVQVMWKASCKFNYSLHGVYRVCFIKHDNLCGSSIYIGLI